jgi:hypothetical protein
MMVFLWALLMSARGVEDLKYHSNEFGHRCEYTTPHPRFYISRKVNSESLVYSIYPQRLFCMFISIIFNQTIYSLL